MKERSRLQPTWLLIGLLLGAALSVGFRVLREQSAQVAASQLVAEVEEGGEGAPARTDPRPLRGAGAELEQPWRMAVVGGRILVSDPRASVVIAVDPATGQRQDLFGTLDGRRVHAGDPVDVAAAPAGGLYVLDVDQQAVLHSASGRVTVVSGGRARGSGPAFDVPIAMAALPGGRLLVLDYRGLCLVAVDPATGDRRLLSGNGAGDGEPWLAPADVAVTPDGRIFVLDTGPARIVEVDPKSGARRAFLDLGDLSPEGLWNPLSLSAGGPGELLVTDLTLSRVVAVDLASRARRIVADPLKGSGPRLTGALDAVRAPDGTLVVSSANGSLLRVDGRGDRSALSGRVPPDGPVKLLPTMAAVVGGRAVVCDPVGNRLLEGAVGRQLSLRELSGPGRGAGPPLRRPHGFAVQDGSALVLDRAGTLTRVDLDTGDRVLVSGEGRGSGPMPGNGFDPVLTSTGKVFLLDRGTAQVLEVDPETGNRRTIPLTERLLRRARGLAADRRVLWIWTMTGIHEVDPGTGSSRRVEVSRSSDAILTPGPSMALPNGTILVAAQDLFGPGKVMRRLPDGEWRTLVSNRDGVLPGTLALGPSDAPTLGDVVLTGFGGQGLFVLESGSRFLRRLEVADVD